MMFGARKLVLSAVAVTMAAVPLAALPSANAVAPTPLLAASPVATGNWTLPQAEVGLIYRHQLRLQNSGVGTWAISAGALPANLTLSTTGLIAGSPTTAGSYSFILRFRDTAGNSYLRSTTLVVKPAAPVTGTITRHDFGANFGYTRLSGDGRYLATTATTDFAPTATVIDVFRQDISSGTSTKITNGNGRHLRPSISRDGRYLAYTSSSFTAGGKFDVYLSDSSTGTRTRVSTRGSANAFGPEISADGRYVVYTQAYTAASGSGVVDRHVVLLYDRVSKATTEISDSFRGGSDVAISADGRYVDYTAGNGSIFRHDVQAGSSEEITTAPTGNERNFAPRLSADGRYTVYTSTALHLTNEISDVFVYDSATKATKRITAGDANSSHPGISADGRFVIFSTFANNIVAGDTRDSGDVFYFDMTTGATTRITSAENMYDVYHSPTISDDGRRVAFTHLNTALANPDGMGHWIETWTRS